jgi:hypothetical protein
MLLIWKVKIPEVGLRNKSTKFIVRRYDSFNQFYADTRGRGIDCKAWNLQ